MFIDSIVATHGCFWVGGHSARRCAAGGDERPYTFQELCPSRLSNAFFDISPRKNRKWCSMSVCGNREKVAAHRKRCENNSTRNRDYNESEMRI